MRIAKRILRLLLFSFTVLLAAAIVCTCVLAITAYVQRGELVCVNYEFADARFDRSVRIAALSDLHGDSFGEDNSALIELTAKQQPDVIVLLGDMVSSTETNFAPLCSLVRALNELAPVYYVLGNHEYTLSLNTPIKDELYAAGARLLDNETATVTIKAQTFTIGGLTRIDFPNLSEDGVFDFLDELTETDNYTLLLCHYPEYYPWFFHRYDYDIDLWLAGHTHGGIVKLPILGRLFAPNQGEFLRRFFPKYVYGAYEVGSTTMLITGGLGNDNFLSRLNNPAEVAVIDLVPLPEQK